MRCYFAIPVCQISTTFRVYLMSHGHHNTAELSFLMKTLIRSMFSGQCVGALCIGLRIQLHLKLLTLNAARKTTFKWCTKNLISGATYINIQ